MLGVNRNLADLIKMCEHSDFTYVEVSDDDVEITDIVCKSCSKKLARRYGCISAVWYDKFDYLWTDKHPELFKTD